MACLLTFFLCCCFYFCYHRLFNMLKRKLIIIHYVQIKMVFVTFFERSKCVVTKYILTIIVVALLFTTEQFRFGQWWVKNHCHLSIPTFCQQVAPDTWFCMLFCLNGSMILVSSSRSSNTMNSCCLQQKQSHAVKTHAHWLTN